MIGLILRHLCRKWALNDRRWHLIYHFALDCYCYTVTSIFVTRIMPFSGGYYNIMIEEPLVCSLRGKIKTQIIKQIFKDLSTKNLKGVEFFYVICSDR